MAKRKSSAFGSAFKRYSAYRTIKAGEIFARGATSAVWETAKLILGICALLIVGYVVVWVFPVALLILAIILIAVAANAVRKHKKEQSGETVHKSGNGTKYIYSDINKATIARTIEIMADCQRLVNESSSFDVVARRYEMLLEKLDELSGYSQAELEGYGFSFGQPVSSIKQNIVDNDVTIICQALDRAFAKEMSRIQTLKTPKGKENALNRFCESVCQIINDYDLPSECYSYLQDLYNSSLTNLK